VKLRKLQYETKWSVLGGRVGWGVSTPKVSHVAKCKYPFRKQRCYNTQINDTHHNGLLLCVDCSVVCFVKLCYTKCLHAQCTGTWDNSFDWKLSLFTWRDNTDIWTFLLLRYSSWPRRNFWYEMSGYDVCSSFCLSRSSCRCRKWKYLGLRDSEIGNTAPSYYGKFLQSWLNQRQFPIFFHCDSFPTLFASFWGAFFPTTLMDKYNYNEGIIYISIK